VTPFDAIIVGAGQAGPSLAGRLTSAGMTVALIERHLFGGTCVNTGCTPTKTMVASAYAAHLARRGADFGVVTGPVSVDIARVRARAEAVVSTSREGVERSLRAMPRCTVIDGHARFEAPDVIRVGAQRLRAPRVFINVGGRATVPRMPGVEAVRHLNNSSLLALDRLPAHLRGTRSPGGPAAHHLRRLPDLVVRRQLRRPPAGILTPATGPRTDRPRPDAVTAEPPACSSPRAQGAGGRAPSARRRPAARTGRATAPGPLLK